MPPPQKTCPVLFQSLSKHEKKTQLTTITFPVLLGKTLSPMYERLVGVALLVTDPATSREFVPSRLGLASRTR